MNNILNETDLDRQLLYHALLIKSLARRWFIRYLFGLQDDIDDTLEYIIAKQHRD